ncbi:DUF1559 domain-containing protein [bacterium]|nr:DUF1559 domain-containing protein [bacterium]
MNNESLSASSEPQETTQTKELMGIGELLKTSWAVIKNNIAILLGIIALYMVVTTGIEYLPVIFQLFALPVTIIISLITGIGLIFAVNNILEGNPADIRESYKTGFKKFFPYCWVIALVCLATVGGLLLLIIPGIIFGVWFSLAYLVRIIEGTGSTGALKRSKQLVKGNWWYVLGAPLVCGIVYGICIYAPIGVLFAIFKFGVKLPTKLCTPIFQIGTALAMVASTAVYVLMFRNLRDIKGTSVVKAKQGKGIGVIIVTCILLGVLFIGGMFAGMMIPALSRAREMARRTKCISNLKQIGLGLHMYAQDNEEKFPNTLSALYPKYISTLDIFKCPAQKEKIKTKADIDTKAGYKYISGLSEDSPSSAVVAHTKKGYFKRGRNVLYVDGHVEWKKKLTQSLNLRSN